MFHKYRTEGPEGSAWRRQFYQENIGMDHGKATAHTSICWTRPDIIWVVSIDKWFAFKQILILVRMVILNSVWATALFTRDARLTALSDAAGHDAGGMMSFYAFTETSTKMWTHLHRLVLWAARSFSSPPRLKDSQCRGKKHELKHFY